MVKSRKLMAFDCTIHLTRLYSTKLPHKNQAAAHIFSKFQKLFCSVLSHALQQTIPQFAALWPERFIYGDALDDGFSVMLRLRMLLLGLFVKSLFLLHGNQSPFTNMNSERHWGIQCLKKLQKILKSVSCIGALDSYL